MCPNYGSDEYGIDCEDYEAACEVCPHCGSTLRYDCDINIETGSLEIFKICYSCGHVYTINKNE